MRSHPGLLLAPMLVLVLVACGDSGAGAGSEPDEAPDITVEVDMMSGVPNPGWTVTGSDAASLVELVDSLPDGGETDAAAGLNLGFRGFLLTGLELPGDATQVRVRGSEVVLSRHDTAGVLRTDADRTLYTMLRAMAAEHLDQNIVQAIPVDGLKGS